MKRLKTMQNVNDAGAGDWKDDCDTVKTLHSHNKHPISLEGCSVLELS